MSRRVTIAAGRAFTDVIAWSFLMILVFAVINTVTEELMATATHTIDGDAQAIATIIVSSLVAAYAYKVFPANDYRVDIFLVGRWLILQGRLRNLMNLIGKAL